MRKRNRKLSLNRETVRVLGQSLQHVKGADLAAPGANEVKILPPDDSCITCSCTDYLTCVFGYCPKLSEPCPDPVVSA